MKKFLAMIIGVIGIAILAPLSASAHVTVTPKEATAGERVLFAVSVPNEKEVAVTSLKLAIPSGLEDVQPNVMAGWDITTQKTGDAVSSITWTGTIPAGQRADFVFKAQVPAKIGDLVWKAQQTYADGTVVHWEQSPTNGTSDADSTTTGPYSVTKVVDDSAAPAASGTTPEVTLALVLSIAALLLGAFSLLWRRK